MKGKRQAFADLRYLVSLEPLAKKLKFPFIQRTGANSINDNAPRPPDPASALSAAAMESIPSNGEIPSPRGQPESRNVMLVIDQRLSMYYGSKQKMKSVIAAEAAALVAWHTFAQKDRIGAIIFGDTDTLMLSPQYSRVQIMLILHDLLNQNHLLSSSSDHKSNPGMLNQALRRAAAFAQGNFQIVLITDGSGQDQETAQLLKSLSAQNDLAVILVYDPRQIEWSVGDCSSSTNRTSLRPGLNRSCSLADGTLTIPLHNQLDVTDQFRRGFRKLLHLRRSRSKQQVQLHQSDGDHPVTAGAALERGEDRTAVSPLPSPGTPQQVCAQLNSR